SEDIIFTVTQGKISWKRRFFVLSKMGEDYQLTYHANNETKEIDLSKISLLRIGPEAHQKWDWIQKNFKCSPSSVLFLKVEDDTPKHSRDYFLIGENRFATIIYTIFLIAITTMKIPVIEHKDEKDEMQDESAEDMFEGTFPLNWPKINNLHCIKCSHCCVFILFLSSVSDCRMIQDSCLFHKGDQILAFNDLLIDTVEEIQMYLRRLSKDEV
uniref:PH domain-containing protein n=1 Tax=Sinocyclocheilus grahami TaxID=75366 RepID=A0A672KVT0_SINGR